MMAQALRRAGLSRLALRRDRTAFGWPAVGIVAQIPCVLTVTLRRGTPKVAENRAVWLQEASSDVRVSGERKGREAVASQVGDRAGRKGG
jgi:hypothetical protein